MKTINMSISHKHFPSFEEQGGLIILRRNNLWMPFRNGISPNYFVYSAALYLGNWPFLMWYDSGELSITESHLVMEGGLGPKLTNHTLYWKFTS